MASTSSAPRSVPQQMDAADCVRNYKALANVERAFRSLKTIDLKVRPIHHRTADRVRAHILLCMLAYYVEWHMREAWRELMFADTEQAGQGHARSGGPGQAIQSRIEPRRQPYELDRWHTRAQLRQFARRSGTIVRNTCRVPNAGRQRADLRDPHHPQRQAASRPRSHRANPTVDTTPTPTIISTH
jgi:hypothetical protein